MRDGSPARMHGVAHGSKPRETRLAAATESLSDPGLGDPSKIVALEWRHGVGTEPATVFSLRPGMPIRPKRGFDGPRRDRDEDFPV